MTLLLPHRTPRHARAQRARSSSLLRLLAAIAGTASFAHAVAMADYTFINIADSSGPLGTNFGAPDINDDGMVAFFNIHDDGTTTAIYTGNGGPITPQIDNQGTFKKLEFAPVINNSNEVAFWAEYTVNGARGIHKVLNGAVTLVADDDNSLFYDFDYYPSINDSGEVAFSGNLYQPCCDSAIGFGASVLYDPSGPFISFNDGVTINNNGVVAFSATFDGGAGSGLFTGSGGAHTTIVTFGGISMFSFIDLPATINDSGAVAFKGHLAGGGTGIFIGSGGPISTVTTTGDGLFSSYGPAGVAFNNAGEIAFLATIAGGSHGIFTGPDPVADKVIQIGDSLFGSIVYSLDFVRGLNDNGDIVFTYVLENPSGGAGVAGVAVAKAPTSALPGDINGDGVVDEDDLVLFCAAIGAAQGEPNYDADADLNGDNVIDELDQQMFNEELPPCAGDVVSSATFAPPPDGVADGADLAYLLGAWGNEPSCADMVTSRTFQPPPDGKVDGADLAYLLGAWGRCE
jgi:hypothetical protein